LLFGSISIMSNTSFTLFPYTTLFRSNVTLIFAGYAGVRKARGRAPARVRPVQMVSAVLIRYALLCKHADDGCADYGADGLYGQRDRKSTRLNSSHVSISYAVCCLKKK